MSNDPDRLFVPGGYYGQRQLSARELHQAARDARAGRNLAAVTGDYLDCEAGQVVGGPPAPFGNTRIYNSSFQTINDNSVTDVNFDTTDFDTLGAATVGGGGFILVVPKDGYYIATGRVRWNTSAIPDANPRNAGLQTVISGGLIAAAENLYLYFASGDAAAVNRKSHTVFMPPTFLASGTVISVKAWQNSGVALTIVSLEVPVRHAGLDFALSQVG